jgi:hypothetical protein
MTSVERRRDILPFGSSQTAADELIGRHKADVRVRDLRQFLRDAIVERKSECDRAQHFILGEFRRL